MNVKVTVFLVVTAIASFNFSPPAQAQFFWGGAALMIDAVHAGCKVQAARVYRRAQRNGEQDEELAIIYNEARLACLRIYGL